MGCPISRVFCKKLVLMLPMWSGHSARCFDVDVDLASDLDPITKACIDVKERRSSAAISLPNPRREAAAECSPVRKPWVSRKKATKSCRDAREAAPLHEHRMRK
jgi:hypothetical protein